MCGARYLKSESHPGNARVLVRRALVPCIIIDSINATPVDLMSWAGYISARAPVAQLDRASVS